MLPEANSDDTTMWLGMSAEKWTTIASSYYGANDLCKGTNVIQIPSSA